MPTDYRRNRLRHEVIPLLDEVFQREVAPIVDRLADQARRDHQCLDEMARDFARFHGIFQEDGSLRITDELRSAAPGLGLKDSDGLTGRCEWLRANHQS